MPTNSDTLKQRPASDADRTTVVYILDEGSVFDMPLDRLWEFLPSEATTLGEARKQGVAGKRPHGHEREDLDGKTARSKLKMTMYPPLGVAQEHIEGPAAGPRRSSTMPRRGT